MKLHQFSIRKMLLVIALVASFFPCETLFRRWLATNHGYSYVEAVLHSEVHEGDSLERVSSHFDSIRLLTPLNDSEYLTNLVMICSRKGLAVLKNDEFYRLSVTSGPSAYLQFRNRRLVNLWNTAYIDAMKYPSRPVSNNARSIFLAIYFCLFATALVSDSFLQHWMRHNKKLQRSARSGVLTCVEFTPRPR